MTEFLKTASLILGLLVTVGTVFCVTLPGLRRLAAARLNRKGETERQLREIRHLLEEQKKTLVLQKKEAELQRQAELCVLRDLITQTYYQYAQEKKIPVYAMENVTALYELYRKRGGNSYVESLMNQILAEWEIVS